MKQMRFRCSLLALAVVAAALAASDARPASQGPRLLRASAEFTSLALDPVHANVVYAGAVHMSPHHHTGRVYKSTDGGNHWRLISGPDWPRVGALAVDPERPRTVYAGTGRAVYKSTNGGRTWKAFRRGLLPPPGINRGEGWVGWLAVDPTESRIVYEKDYAGTIRKSVDGGHTWKVLVSCWQRCGVESLLTVPSRPTGLYAAFWVAGPKGGEPGAYRSTDGGKTWQKMNLPAPSAPGYMAASAADPQQNTIYFAIGNRIFASTDSGRAWRLIGQGLPKNPQDQSVTSLAAGAGTVYASVGGQATGIYQSSDWGGTWTRTWPVGDGAISGVIADQLAVDPANPSIVYALDYYAGNSHILRTTNSGHTWTEIG